MMLSILLALAAGGAFYYLCVWFASRRLLGRMNYIEVRNAQIEEDLRDERKLGARQRVDHALLNLGYSGDWTPLLIAVTVMYLAIAVVLSFLGVSDLLATALALPIALTGALTGLATARRRRTARFDRQLLQVVASVATYLEAGDVPQMAFQKSARLIDDPLRSEIDQALASKVGSESLASAMRPLVDRYPSRAMSLLVTALNIDDQVGAKLSPALRQAQRTLERQFELAAEGQAEIAQARGEFYAITVIIGLVGVLLVVSSGPSAQGAYASPAGFLVLGVTLTNYALGIWRARRIFRKAGRS